MIARHLGMLSRLRTLTVDRGLEVGMLTSISYTSYFISLNKFIWLEVFLSTFLREISR